MNIRFISIAILIAALSAHASMAMDDMDKARIGLKLLQQASTLVRIDLVQRFNRATYEEAQRICRRLPYAPDRLQTLWHEAQTLMCIAPEQQKPLRIHEEGDQDGEFRTMACIASVAPSVAEHFGDPRVAPLYGYVRCSLVHEAGHIKLGNTDRAQREHIAWICAQLSPAQVWKTYFIAHARGDDLALYARLVSMTPGENEHTHHVLCAIERETDELMLRTIDCEQCVNDYLFFITNSSAQRDVRGYASLDTVRTRALELAGRRCHHHSAHWRVRP